MEQNYDIYKWEFLGVVKALEHWRPYLSPPQHVEKLLYDEDRCTCDLEWQCIPHNACFIHNSCFCEGSGSFPSVKPPPGHAVLLCSAPCLSPYRFGTYPAYCWAMVIVCTAFYCLVASIVFVLLLSYGLLVGNCYCLAFSEAWAYHLYCLSYDST